MNPSTQLYRFNINYLNIFFVIAICSVQGITLLKEVPPNPLHASIGGTARFFWDYTVDNRGNEFQFNSPKWKYYPVSGPPVDIAFDQFLQNWSWIINTKTCPPRLLKPTVRVSKESNATLVISNVTTADSGIYGMDLLLKAEHPITSKIQLIVTTRPEFSSRLQASNIILEGEDLNISCSATGMPTPNITWVLLKDQTQEIKSQGVGYAELFIPNITRHQDGLYQCQATNNPNEYPVENQTEVIIWYKPSITFLNVSVHGKIVLLCLANGQPRPLIKWYYPSGEQVVSGVTDITDSRTSLEISVRNSLMHELYKCNASNEVGWQVGYINISVKNHPTTRAVTDKDIIVTSKLDIKTKVSSVFASSTITRMSSIAFTTTPDLDKNEKSGINEEKTEINLSDIILLGVSCVILLIIAIVLVVIVLRKRREQRNNTENGTDADKDKNIRLQTILPGPSNIVTYAEVSNNTIYAKVGTSKKTERSENTPVYAQVDKTKKRYPGQIIYAELEDLKSTTDTPCVVLPPRYNATEYADIANLHNKYACSNPEPIYETLPDNS